MVLYAVGPTAYYNDTVCKSRNLWKPGIPCADISDIFPLSFTQLFIKAIKHTVLFLFHRSLEPVQPILTFSFYIQYVRNNIIISNDKIQIQNQWAWAEILGAQCNLKGRPLLYKLDTRATLRRLFVKSTQNNLLFCFNQITFGV